MGYLAGKTSSNLLKTDLNVPLVFVLSMITDADILLPILDHRGPAHSIIILSIVFVPFFALYRKRAIPYFIATLQHPLIGDYIAGGQTQLLWPLTAQYYSSEINITGQANIALEWIMLLTALIIMLRTKDLTRLLKPHNSNMLLLIPTSTLILPTLTGFPIPVPALLIPPHLVLALLFILSILIELKNRWLQPVTEKKGS